MSIRINLNIFLFVILFFITSQLEVYSLVMLFALIHELGHLFCGVLLGFEAECFKIMPLGFAVKFKTNINDYNIKILKSNLLTIKKLLINLAGPITNIIIVVVGLFFKVDLNIICANLVILVFNLLPIYPLDGGRIINNIFKLFLGNKDAYKCSNNVSNVIVIIITIISSVAIYYFKNVAILFALVFIWTLVIIENKRFKTYRKMYKLIEEKGFK